MFTSSDGFEILVGRNAEANERADREAGATTTTSGYTPRGPARTWCCAIPRRFERAKRRGVCAKPRRSQRISAPPRGATKVNVRWTQTRHVKKPRKGPKGQVVLRQGAFGSRRTGAAGAAVRRPGYRLTNLDSLLRARSRDPFRYPG